MKLAELLNRVRGPLVTRLAGIVLVGLLGAASGCGEDGPPTAHLQGTVTIGGQPLPADATGQIVFNPSGENQAKPRSAEISNGHYDMPNAPQGPVKVLFDIVQPDGPEYTTDRGDKARHTKSLVPDAYATGIDIEVSGDNDAQDFDLK